MYSRCLKRFWWDYLSWLKNVTDLQWFFLFPVFHLLFMNCQEAASLKMVHSNSDSISTTIYPYFLMQLKWCRSLFHSSLEELSITRVNMQSSGLSWSVPMTVFSTRLKTLCVNKNLTLVYIYWLIDTFSSWFIIKVFSSSNHRRTGVNHSKWDSLLNKEFSIVSLSYCAAPLNVYTCLVN